MGNCKWQEEMLAVHAQKKSINTVWYGLATPLLMIVDLLGLSVAVGTAYMTRSFILARLFRQIFITDLTPGIMQNLWYLPILLIIFMMHEGLYHKRLSFWIEAEKIIKACFLAMIFSMSILYLTKIGGQVSRPLIMLTWVASVVIIPLVRYFGKVLLGRVGIWNKPILVVGAGKTGEIVLQALTREHTIGYKIIGFLDDDLEKKGEIIKYNGQVIQVLGSFDDAPQVIKQYKINDIIVATPGLPSSRLVLLTNKLQQYVSNVMLVPDLFGIALNGIEAQYFFYEQTLLLQIKNNLKSALNRGIKRLFDLVIGSIIMALCLPFMIIIGISIKLDSKGSVFFSHKRIGQSGKLFVCYKFRTMHLNGNRLLKKYFKVNPEVKIQWETYAKIKGNDPRVTRVGSVLRSFSLDELPQLINVLKGNMSLVGPRPYLPRENEKIGDWAKDIHITKPGITGLWQVSGRNDIDFQGRMQLDVWYVRNWSLWLDIILLVKTIKVVICRDGAY